MEAGKGKTRKGKEEKRKRVRGSEEEEEEEVCVCPVAPCQECAHRISLLAGAGSHTTLSNAPGAPPKRSACSFDAHPRMRCMDPFFIYFCPVSRLFFIPLSPCPCSVSSVGISSASSSSGPPRPFPSPPHPSSSRPTPQLILSPPLPMITARANQDRVPSSQDVLSESQDAGSDSLFQKVVFYLNPFLGAEKVAKVRPVVFCSRQVSLTLLPHQR